MREGEREREGQGGTEEGREGERESVREGGRERERERISKSETEC